MSIPPWSGDQTNVYAVVALGFCMIKEIQNQNLEGKVIGAVLGG